jgi:hypothetical protein
MTRLADSDPTALIEGPEGTIRWAPNDAYAQAHSNKPEYAGHVLDVSKNILPVQGRIHSYYTPSPNTTPPSAVVSEMIQSAIQLEQQHKQEIEELKEEINQQHKQQMDALTAALTEQFTQRMDAQLDHQAAQYEERFHLLEGHRVGIPEPSVTTERALQDVGSPARIIPRSSADTTQGNNILPFSIN